MSTERNYEVILGPRFSEKAHLVSQDSQVVFDVDVTATKLEIKKAVKALFKVDVVNVKTLKVKGKTRKFKGIDGKQKDTKKAYVRLAEGQTIDFVGAEK